MPRALPGLSPVADALSPAFYPDARRDEEIHGHRQSGSEEHKQLFCLSFIETHRPYEPRDMPWPVLDDVSLARLRAIPVWSMALSIEVTPERCSTDLQKRNPTHSCAKPSNCKATRRRATAAF